MILCCDVINLVRRAAKDIKVQYMLNRKRSETSRAASLGRYQIVNHLVDEKAIKDYEYERDSINKVAKVTQIDNKLMNEREKERSSRF